MCRPSCCNKTGGPATGIAAVAVLIGAALVAAKIAPVVARMTHTVVELIRLVALTTVLVVALAAVTGAAVGVTRWQLRRKAVGFVPARVTGVQSTPQTEWADRPECLACGGTGTVLRALSNGRYLPGECPVCEPVQRAG
jgi:hypothetical protein